MQTSLTAKAAAPFIGTWRLVSAEFYVTGGETSFPLGEDPQGLLIYDACGNMAAQLMRPGRPPLASGDQRTGTTEEIREAFEGYVAYFGSFTVDPQAETVTHRVTASLLPNWIGEPQVRYYEISGDTLVLRTPPIQSGGREIVGSLVWTRCRPLQAD